MFDALDSGRLRLDERLTVSRAAAMQAPVRLGLRAGATISVRNAMRAVAVKSSNDAAVVLAEALSKDERRFARLITAKARAIGMRNTVFGNASGLPDKRTWTTARDIALLARAILKEPPDRYPLFGRRTLVWNQRDYSNHNRLLGHVVGIDGIKTGYTDEAGFTLAASAKRAERADCRLIAVAFGFRSAGTRDDRVSALLETGSLSGAKQMRRKPPIQTAKVVRAADQTLSGSGISDRPQPSAAKVRI